MSQSFPDPKFLDYKSIVERLTPNKDGWYVYECLIDILNLSRHVRHMLTGMIPYSSVVAATFRKEIAYFKEVYDILDGLGYRTRVHFISI